jgi:hypothetical protein
VVSAPNRGPVSQPGKGAGKGFLFGLGAWVVMMVAAVYADQDMCCDARFAHSYVLAPVALTLPFAGAGLGYVIGSKKWVPVGLPR